MSCYPVIDDFSFHVMARLDEKERSLRRMFSLDRFANDKLADLDRADLRRTLAETTRDDGLWVERNGKRLLSFCCNDYLNLTHHPAVKQAAIEALQRYGAGSGASRLVTGNHPLFAELERRLAQLKGAEAACVFGSGYLANTGIIPALIGRDDLVVIDELAHACLWAGARLTRGKVLMFRHNDVAHAAALLAESRAQHPRAMIATDGVFSMDGDLAPLAQLADLARRFDAWLICDDAHGVGVLGGGRGSGFAQGMTVDIPLQMGTLSKSIGAYGGYLCASQPVIDLIRNRARTLIYSTGLPPAIAAAAIAAIDVIESEPHTVALPLAKAKAFTRRAGLPEAASTIVPVVVGDAASALRAARMLEAEGFLVVPIRPPTVPAGTARLRLTFSAAHPDDQIERLADIVRARILECQP
jgi:8-amino-7-oxononanoate synthase